MVVAYDSIIEEPCAYNVHIDQKAWGTKSAEWLVDKLGGKGNVVMVTGVPGTTVDDSAQRRRQGGLRQASRHQGHRRSQRHVEPGGGPHRAFQGAGHAALGPDRRPLDAGRLLHRELDAERGRHRRRQS